MCVMDAMRSAPKIGKTIKRARERKRMSQAEAAEALGVSRSALNAWENDRAYPRSSVGAIEELYEISLDDEPQPKPRPAISERLRQEIMTEPGLSDSERQAVIDAVEKTLARERGEEVEGHAGGSAAGSRPRPGRARPAS